MTSIGCTMQIGKIFYPIESLGPGVRVGIWTVGCLRDCPGCSNPELQPFDPDKNAEVGDIMAALDSIPYQAVTITGGEPFLQTPDLRKMVGSMRKKGIRDILVYTGFTMEELRARHDPDTDYILENIGVLIDGPFVTSLDGDRLRGSSNQRIWYLDETLRETYTEYLEQKKTIDIINTENETHFIGIPERDYKQIYNGISPGEITDE